ncbi:MAG: hypothetical protein GY720_02160 [bacterium]|nr:hypothetical protein [bacterium]
MKSAVAVTVVNALLLATLFLLLTPSPAQACSCAGPKPLDEAIAESEWVFVGRQVDRRESGQQEVRPEDEDWFYGPILLEIEVVAVFKGDVPNTVELFTGRGGGDCGTDFASRTEVGFTVTPRDDGLTGIGSCGGSVRADALRLAFEPLPGESAPDRPAFSLELMSDRHGWRCSTRPESYWRTARVTVG